MLICTRWGMKSEQRRVYWWWMDELWRDLNNKWGLFNQKRESWKRGVLREVVGHFVEATVSKEIWGIWIIPYWVHYHLSKHQMNYSVHGGPCECAHSTATVPLQQENRRKVRRFHMHTYGSRERNTWEESVNCQHGDIKPSYIKQFMKPLMMQPLYLHHMTEETLNIILTFILSDKLPAILKGMRRVNLETRGA